MQLRIETVHRIADCDCSQWDHLAGDWVFSRCGWLQTVEETHRSSCDPLYIMAFDGTDLVGAVVCYVMRQGGQFLNLDSRLFGRLMPLANFCGCSFFPVLLCGALEGYGSHFLTRPGTRADHRETIYQALFAAVKGQAKSRGLSLALVNMLPHERQLLGFLRRQGFLETSAFPLAYLDIHWSDFDSYLESLRRINKKQPANCKKEIRRNREAGVIIEELSEVGEERERLFDLLNENTRRHNGVPLMFKSGFLGRLKENLGSAAALYVARKNGTAIGASLMLQGSSLAFKNLIGVDNQRSAGDYTYFTIGYYRPIADAIARGIQRIYFGTAQYQSKAWRGCAFMEAAILYRHRFWLVNQLIRPWFLVHRVWIRRKISLPRCPAPVQEERGGMVNS